MCYTVILIVLGANWERLFYRKMRLQQRKKCLLILPSFPILLYCISCCHKSSSATNVKKIIIIDSI